MKRQRISTGSAYEKLVGYSRALAVGDWVFVSGTTGRDHETGEIPEDVVEQTRMCFKTIERALAEAGSSLADVVRMRILMVDPADDARVASVLSEYLKPVGPALTTTVGALLDARFKIEIDVTALKSPSDA
ncbi:MAG: RidA family protein [Rhizobiales bacterium]|nr:RidA family protein [Hyphomicrobiales bacterium]MBN9010541.1 RidA family protein [Hyphomicrobiales bacterium]